MRILVLGLASPARRLLLVATLMALVAACNDSEPDASVAAAEAGGSAGYVARVEQHTPAELDALLGRAELLLASQADDYPDYPPIEFILHGPEAVVFLRSRYAQYRDLVDRAARLDAFGIVDIKICETWMASNDVDRAQLPPFVETVPYGPAAEAQLFRDGYIYF